MAWITQSFYCYDSMNGRINCVNVIENVDVLGHGLTQHHLQFTINPRLTFSTNYTCDSYEISDQKRIYGGNAHQM